MSIESIEAELPDGTILDFPANTPQSVVDATVKKHLGGTQSKLSPAQQAAYADVMQNRPWGSGIPKLAHELGGQITDLTGSPAAGYVGNVLTQAVPALLSSYNLGPGGGSMLEVPAKWLMRNAAKPPLDMVRSGKDAQVIDTMLKGGAFGAPFHPTKGGVEAIKARISTLSDEVSSALEGSTATVDKGTVAGYLSDALKKFEAQVNPLSDVAAIESAWTQFLQHPLLIGKDQIPVTVAQALKQGTYRSLGEKAYGELQGASIEAQKTLARGLKEEISKAVPGVAARNKEESQLFDALSVAERRAAIDANKNPIGLGWLAQPWMIPLWMWDRSSAAKAMTAQVLHQGSKAENLAPFATAIGTNRGLLNMYERKNER